MVREAHSMQPDPSVLPLWPLAAADPQTTELRGFLVARFPAVSSFANDERRRKSLRPGESFHLAQMPCAPP